MNFSIGVSVVLCMFALTGCSQHGDESVDKAVPVKIFTVKAESISRYIRATGSVAGERDVVLFSKMPERVHRVYVAPGQAVTKRQLLVEQKNELQKQGLDIAVAALKTAEAQAALAAAEYERMNRLHQERAISPQQYDQAKLAKESADHALEQARSMQQQAKEQLENSLTRAPFNGVAAAVYVEDDQMLAVGQPVVQVLSPSHMKAEVYLTGQDIHHVRVGQRVVIQFPAIPGEQFAGRVNKINTAIDQTSKTLEVEITVLSKDSRITSGMFGEFLIETEHHPGSVVVPEAALLSQTEIQIDRETGQQQSIKKFYLYVIEGSTAKMREVRTGIANSGQIQVVNGVKTGDSVIVVGQNIVKEGRPVTVIE